MSTFVELENPSVVTHTCSKCQRTLPDSKFYLWKGKLHSKICKDCKSVISKARQQRGFSVTEEISLTEEILPSWKKDRYRRHSRLREIRKNNKMTCIDKKISKQKEQELRKQTVCFYCGKTGILPEIEHFFPLSKGGTNHAYNLVASCAECNAKKFMSCGTWMLLVIGEKNV